MDWIRSFLQGIRAAPSNEELGRRAKVYPDDAQIRKSIPGEHEDQLQTNEKLKEFRMLVGITTHPSFKAPRGFDPKQRPVVTSKGRPAPNLGLYPTVVANQFKTKKNFKNFSTLINFCLGLQIIVAASLTALGASNSSHKVVTAFGGVNTVIAGFLTYLKGSGLPNRLKYFHHQWSKVREYIEAKERDLGTTQHAHEIDIHHEVDVIRAMFEEVKADVEANTPDRFVGTSFGSKTLSLRASSLAEGKEAGSEASGKLDGSITGLREARSKVEGLAKDILAKDVDGNTTSSEVNRARSRLSADVSILKSKLQQKMKEVEELEQGIEAEVDTQAKNVIVMGEKGAVNFAEEAKELGDLEKDIEHF